MNNPSRGFDNYLAESESSYMPPRSVLSLFVNTGDLSRKLFVCCEKDEITKNVCKIIANIYYKTFMSEGLSDDSDDQLDDSYYAKIENQYIKVEHLEFNGFILPAQQKIGELLENKSVVSAKLTQLNQSSRHEAKARKSAKAKKSPVVKVNESEIFLLDDEVLPQVPPQKKAPRSIPSASKSTHSNGKAFPVPNQTVEDILESFTKKVKTNDHTVVKIESTNGARSEDNESTFAQPKRKRGRPPKDASNAIRISVSPTKKPEPMNTPQILKNKKEIKKDDLSNSSDEEISRERSPPKTASKENKPNQTKPKKINIENDPTQILPTLDWNVVSSGQKISVENLKPQNKKAAIQKETLLSDSDDDSIKYINPKQKQLNSLKPQQKPSAKIHIQSGENGVRPGLTKRKGTFDVDSSSSGSSMLIQANKTKKDKKPKNRIVKKLTGSSATSSDMELENDLKKPMKNTNLF